MAWRPDYRPPHLLGEELQVTAAVAFQILLLLTEASAPTPAAGLLAKVPGM